MCRMPLQHGFFNDVPRAVQCQLAVQVSLDGVSVHSSGTLGALSKLQLAAFANRALFVAAPKLALTDELKVVAAGSQLAGFLKLDAAEKETLRPRFRRNGQRSDASLSVPIHCNFGAAAKAPESAEKLDCIKHDANADADADADGDDLESTQRDAVTGWISKKLCGAEQRAAFEALGGAMLERWPKHLALQLLEVLDKATGNGTATLERAERIVAAQDVEAIASFFGKKAAAERTGGDYEALLKAMKAKKPGVVEALKAKVKSLWRRQCRGDDDNVADSAGGAVLTGEGMRQGGACASVACVVCVLRVVHLFAQNDGSQRAQLLDRFRFGADTRSPSLHIKNER